VNKRSLCLPFSFRPLARSAGREGGIHRKFDTFRTDELSQSTTISSNALPTFRALALVAIFLSQLNE
jgi:hypothetical protein